MHFLKNTTARFLLILLSTLFLSGCASLRNQSAEWPWRDKTSICNKEVCNEQDALNAYLQAHEFCRNVYNFYERKGNRLGISQFVLGTVGSLAGAVIAPISSGGAATAWSGLSGTTNAIQGSMDENLSGSLAINVTNEVRKATEDAQAEIDKASSPQERVFKSINMATACAMAQSKAEKAVIKALAKDDSDSKKSANQNETNTTGN